MSATIELELTFLARALPDLNGAHEIPMEDVHVPEDMTVHPRLRVRRRGQVLGLTKKLPIAGSDASGHTESTIPLTAPEYDALVQGHTRRIVKTRYQCELAGRRAEVDVFGDALSGLVLIDFEFDDLDELPGSRPRRSASPTSPTRTSWPAVSWREGRSPTSKAS